MLGTGPGETTRESVMMFKSFLTTTKDKGIIGEFLIDLQNMIV